MDGLFEKNNSLMFSNAFSWVARLFLLLQENIPQQSNRKPQKV